MEHGWKCCGDEGVVTKRLRCKITVIGICLVLFALLMLTIAVSSYAADTLTLEQAIETAIKNNPGLKAADAQVEAA